MYINFLRNAKLQIFWQTFAKFGNNVICQILSKEAGGKKLPKKLVAGAEGAGEEEARGALRQGDAGALRSYRGGFRGREGQGSRRTAA